MQILVEYPWPGNVRELRNLVESMVVLSPGREIGPDGHPAADPGGRERAVPSGARRSGRCAGRRASTGGSWSSSCAACVELKLQVEELRRRMDDGPPKFAATPPRGAFIGEVRVPGLRQFGGATRLRDRAP